MSEDPLLPFQNPDTREYWKAALAGRLVVQRCASCGAAYAFPRPYCIKCFSDSVKLVDCSGRGTVYARTIVHLPSTPGGPVGHTVVLVDLVEGVRLPARFEGVAATIGQPVTLSWKANSGKPVLLARPD